MTLGAAHHPRKITRWGTQKLTTLDRHNTHQGLPNTPAPHDEILADFFQQPLRLRTNASLSLSLSLSVSLSQVDLFGYSRDNPQKIIVLERLSNLGGDLSIPSNSMTSEY